MGADELTDKQKKSLIFIQLQIKKHGRPPTLREIGAEVGISSTNGVRYLLDALERKGYLARSPMLSRGIELTARSAVVDESGPVREIPVLGRVAAGAPLLAVENVESKILVDRGLVGSGETFALRIKGDSMKDAGILEGDVIFAKPQETAERGDVVVALLGDEATVKYYQPQGSRIRLEPANTYFSAIIVEKGTPGFRILGKVIGLMRKI